MRALSKVPADRFATVAEFASALATADLGGPKRRTTRRTTAQRYRASRWRSALLSLAVIPVLAAGYGAWRIWVRPIQTAGAGVLENALDARRVAVLYFEDLTSDKRLAYLTDGLTEALIDELEQVDALDVVSQNGVAALRDADVGRDSIARALKAGTLVEGTIENVGNRLRVSVRLVDGNSGADFQRGSIERPASDLLGIRDTLALEVARLIRRRLGEEVRLRQQREGTEKPEAWALVQRAERTRKDAEVQLASDNPGGAAAAFALADSLLAKAEALDPKWSQPLVSRAAIDFRQARLAAADPARAASLIKSGLGHAERAIKLDARNPDALELRGSLRYLRWLYQLVPVQADADRLLAAAEQDLRAAVTLSPSQAGAWNVLSHLYMQKDDAVEAKLAARRAYESDAYLANAADIIWRLYTASFELEQFVDAEQWCDEGQRRFPTNARYTQCRVWLLVSRAKAPDVNEAWRLVGELEKLTPREQWAYDQHIYHTLVAGVLARAGLADSAKRVLSRARATPETDPRREIVSLEAFVQLLLGDRDEALRLLKVYLTANPGHRMGDMGWWWRDLENDPRFRELVSTAR
jgi:TolB-like protein